MLTSKHSEFAQTQDAENEVSEQGNLQVNRNEILPQRSSSDEMGIFRGALYSLSVRIAHRLCAPPQSAAGIISPQDN